MHPVLEGLQDEAFEFVRDIGVESLSAPGGLRALIDRVREIVFQRPAEEARELFWPGSDREP